jgi:hypothetical protein
MAAKGITCPAKINKEVRRCLETKKGWQQESHLQK